jgi:hypothetical protein
MARWMPRDRDKHAFVENIYISFSALHQKRE